MNKLMPKKFESAKVCKNCGLEFMPQPENREYCKGCDPQNSGTPIKIKIVPDKDLVMEGKAEKHERKLIELEKRIKRCEERIDSILSEDKEVGNIVEDNLTNNIETKTDAKGHYPKVCKKCGEAFIAEWPSRTICDACKEKNN